MIHEELPREHEDRMIRQLHRLIRLAIRALAVLMAFLILWGVVDVVYVIYQRMMAPPLFVLDVHDIFQAFGAVLVVLIAIEIFINVRLYLGSGVLPLQLVVATALMAIARKVIVLDFDTISHNYLLGIAAIVVGLGVSYWLIAQVERGGGSQAPPAE